MVARFEKNLFESNARGNATSNISPSLSQSLVLRSVIAPRVSTPLLDIDVILIIREAFLQASGILPNLEQGELRRSQRKRKSWPFDTDAAEPSEPANKRERTTFSEDEVEFKLTVLDPEAAEATGSATGIQIEDHRGVDQIEIPNSVGGLTDAEIKEVCAYRLINYL